MGGNELVKSSKQEIYLGSSWGKGLDCSLFYGDYTEAVCNQVLRLGPTLHLSSAPQRLTWAATKDPQRGRYSPSFCPPAAPCPSQGRRFCHWRPSDSSLERLRCISTAGRGKGHRRCPLCPRSRPRLEMEFSHSVGYYSWVFSSEAAAMLHPAWQPAQNHMAPTEPSHGSSALLRGFGRLTPFL